MVVAMISGNTLQFQYFWNFNKCLQSIFSQLAFENFWLYLLGAKLFWLKIIQNCYKISHLFESVNYRSELSSHQIYSKMLRQFSKGSLTSVSLEWSKIHLLIKVLYRHIWFNLCRRYLSFHAPNVLLAAVQLYNVLVLRSFDMKIFQLCQC